MKGDIEDLKNWAEDLKGSLERHKDAVEHNPDIAAAVTNASTAAERRYKRIVEPPEGPLPHYPA